jgi:hypothetical protein
VAGWNAAPHPGRNHHQGSGQNDPESDRKQLWW